MPSAPAPIAAAPAPPAPPSGAQSLRSRSGASTPLRAGLAGLAWQAGPTLLVATVLCLTTFIAGGGLQLGPSTNTEIALTLGAGLTIAAAIMLTPRGRPLSGAWAAILMLLFTALTAISVGWSVTPDVSWQEAARLLAYSAVFIAAVAVARAAPRRFDAVLGGIVIAAVVICVYALLTKVFPAQLDPSDPYARLREPYGYWNATGLAAAMGIIACLWLGAKRSGHALLGVLAYPACGLAMVTLMMAYSRGSVAVAVVGVAVWLAIVPLRLRGAALLLAAGACAGGVVAFAFSNSVLSSENVALAARQSAGGQLGALLLAMVVVLLALGIAIRFAAGRRTLSPATRRRAGVVLLGAVVVALIAGVGGLAASHRGLTGTISHDFSKLTNPNATLPSNTPGRLESVGSVRARYWKQAIQVFEAHPALGAGAGGYATARLRVRTEGEGLTVRHAHGYIVQTLADLGLVGLALTLALMVAWMVAAGRATHPFNRRWSKWRWRSIELPYTPERIGLLSMLSLVVAFALHSLEDWTWYVPGTAVTALICAGWLAGRGSIEATAARRGREQPTMARPRRERPTPAFRRLLGGRVSTLQAGAALAVVATALLAAWTEWQPLRSNESSQEALALLSSNRGAALRVARAAVSEDPLSAEALFRLAVVEQSIGEPAKARATLQRAVERQPANPAAWLTLGEYDLGRHPHAALGELKAALYLDPQSTTVQNEYVLALRANSGSTGTGST